MTIGKPIVLQDFIREHADLDIQKQMRQLLLLLEEKMKDNIICIPSGEDYDAIWEGTNIFYGRKRKQDDSLYDRMRWMQKMARELGASRSGILGRLRKVREWRLAKGIRLASLSERRSPFKVALNIFLLIILFPIFALSAVLISPALTAVALLKRNLKDKAFLNSIRYGACTLLNPLVLLPICLLLLLVLPWWIPLAAFLYSFFAPIAFYDWLGGLKRVVSDIILAREAKQIPL